MTSLSTEETTALKLANRGLKRSEKKFDDAGNCLNRSCRQQQCDTTYTTVADVSGTRMQTLICDECGAALPLFPVQL